MGVINGSQDRVAFRMKMRKRYGQQMMSALGVLQATLAEPCCDHKHEDKEERSDSAQCDMLCLNAIRVMVYDVDPLEDFA